MSHRTSEVLTIDRQPADPLASSPRRFRELLREHRIRRGFSQEYLAEKAGISTEAISSLERGTRRAPYRSTMVLLVSALQLDDVQSQELEEAASHARARGQMNTARPSTCANNLSAQLSSFVGRSSDVDETLEALKVSRLVTLTGAAGIGKTRLALHVARELCEAGFEGVWFVDLAPVSQAELVSNAALTIVNAPVAPNREPLDSLIAHLRDKHVTLILDNCEHLIDGAAAVTDAVLRGCISVHVLATSRQVLGVAGERIIRLPPLSFPVEANTAGLTVDAALEYGSVRLFVDRANDTDNRFQITEALVPTIVEICRRLDGIALAIELAAARINALSPVEILESLRQRFSVLTGGKRTAPARHRTLSALLDWSYELLDERERRLLRKLSTFVGGFTLELATRLCACDDSIEANEVLDILGSLVDKSLVQYESQDGSMRYRLLESTKEYSREKLRERNESDGAERAHAICVLEFVERFSFLDLVPDRVWKAHQKEMENWRAALEWAFGPQGDVAIGRRLAAALDLEVWPYQGATEGCQWLRRALDTCDDTTSPAIRAKLEFAHATMLTRLHQANATLATANRALSLYQEAGDLLGVAAAHSLIAEALVSNHRISEAEASLRSALSAAEAGATPKLVATMTSTQAIARAIDGDLNSARRLIRKLINIYESAGCERKKLFAQTNLADFEFKGGDPEEALRLSLDSAHGFREYSDLQSVAAALSNAAAYSIALSRFDEARIYARDAVFLAAGADAQMEFAWAAQHLAAIAVLQPIVDGAELRRVFGCVARTLGFADERLLELGRPRFYTEQQEYDKVIGLLRREFGSQLDELLNEGARRSAEDVLEELSAL